MVKWLKEGFKIGGLEHGHLRVWRLARSTPTIYFAEDWWIV